MSLSSRREESEQWVELLARLVNLLVVGALSVIAVAISTKENKPHGEADAEPEEESSGASFYFLLPFREVRNTVAATAPITCGLITEELVSCIITLVSENAGLPTAAIHAVDISFCLLLFVASAKVWGSALARHHEHLLADGGSHEPMSEPLVEHRSFDNNAAYGSGAEL